MKPFLIDAEKCHTFTLQPENEFDLIGGYLLYIDGVIKGREGVGFAAGAPDEMEVVLGSQAIRPPKHHVFEHVGKTPTVRGIIFGTDDFSPVLLQ